jgi:hypothetical protein
MILEHRGARPTIDPSAYVAPTALVRGRRGHPALLAAHREDRECG